jgi:hypothetical protein
MGPCTLDGFANVLKAPMVGPVGGGHTFMKGGIPPPLEVINDLRLGATRHYLLLAHLPVNSVSLA